MSITTFDEDAMMTFTRRTFLQSTTSTAVCLAAETITGSSWLLRRSDPIRIGLVCLDASAFEHMTVYSALAGAQIVALCDSDLNRLRTAARFLGDRNQPAPSLTQTLDRLLEDSSIHAISIAGSPVNHLGLIRRIRGAGKPLLFDAPIVNSWVEALRTSQMAAVVSTPLRSRLRDYLEPGTTARVTSIFARGSLGALITSSVCARELATNASSPCVPAMACVNLLLESSAAGRDRSFYQSSRVWEQPKVKTLAGGTVVEFPANDSDLKCLLAETLVNPLSPAALLKIEGASGRLVCVASRYPLEISSAQTFVEFLAAARAAQPDKNEAVRLAYLAAGLTHLMQVSSS
jgi:hypothetical protein